MRRRVQLGLALFSHDGGKVSAHTRRVEFAKGAGCQKGKLAALGENFNQRLFGVLREISVKA